jgi:hypothetical protein
MSLPRRPRKISSEFSGAALGDARLDARLSTVADQLAAAPSESFPTLSVSEGELEGVYRFFGNKRVTPAGILAPHIEATKQRAGKRQILMVHDTTMFSFGGATKREGLGRLHSGAGQGFLGHFALAVKPGESRHVLGVAGLSTIVRSAPAIGRKATRSELMKRERREHERWIALVAQVKPQFPDAIHLMDREGDSFEILEGMFDLDARFVIRMRSNMRRVSEREGEKLDFSDVAAGARVRLTRSVPLSRRTGSRLPVVFAHPRKARNATLEIRAARVTLPRPNDQSWKLEPHALIINVVFVSEINPPDGDQPINWILGTSEPIGTRQEIEAIVDAYRSRWVVEEFFKALKTGCAYEKRQLESFKALVNALAVFSVIAWRLLRLRSTAKDEPDASASRVLSQRQIDVLNAVAELDNGKRRRVRLPTKPTANDAIRAVAGLGGHLRSNGIPGWQVLGRGYDALLVLELGWRARERCDR